MSNIYQFPPHEEVVLSNGLRLILVPDEEQDGMVAALQFPIGTFSDPVGYEGTVELCAGLLQKGCGELNAEQFNEKMEYAGASVSIDVGEEHVTLGVRMLSSKLNEIFPLFWKMILEPRMDGQEFTRLQKEMITGLKAEITEPAVLANRHYYRALCGKEHPAGRFYSIKSIKNITVERIRNFYKENFSMSGSILVLAGKFNPADFRTHFNSLLHHSTNIRVTQPIQASSVSLPQKTLRFIDKPILTQATIIMGHSLPGESYAHKAELAMANYILGGGNFSSRLMNKVRSSDGRTYGISSQIATERHFGTFLIQTTTQNNQVGLVIQSILQAFRDFYENGVTQQELENAKQFAIGNMAFQLEGIVNIAEKLLWLRFYERSNSYIENFDTMINQITLEGINTTIRSIFSPENLITVVVGRKAEILPQLKDLGTISNYHFRDKI